MIGEIDVYGVFVPTLLLWVVLALAVAAGLRRVLRRCGFYSFVWHRPLFDLALLVVVLGVVVALANWLV
jgi:Protein of unknown function (DUF1656)